jgi:RNA recognition motif-containing protein
LSPGNSKSVCHLSLSVQNYHNINLLRFITSMNIYVGNLDRQANEIELKQLFTNFGEVRSVKIMKDHETGESRGFAFVEMPDEASATKAIRELDFKEFSNRRLKVNAARPKSDGPRVYNSFSSSYGYKSRNEKF